jgi:PAS domain S-box-containing protein
MKIVAKSIDATESNPAEAPLRESEEQWKAVFENVPTMLLMVDANGTIVSVNSFGAHQLGYTVDDLIGRPIQILLHEADSAAAEMNTANCLKQPGRAMSWEARKVHKDGQVLWVRETASAVLIKGRLVALIVCEDITESKRADEERRAIEARLRTFVDHATDGFFLHDEHLIVVDVNRQACESLGFSREEMIGMHPSNFDVGLDKAAIARLATQVTTGETVTFESIHRRKDGTVFPVEIRAHRFEQGQNFYRLSLVRDITERKRAEKVLRESEARLEEAQRIAHVGWWERDFATNHVALSDEVCRIFGVPPVDLPHWHERWLTLIHPADRPRAADAAAAALSRGGPRYDVEYRVVRPDGTVRRVHSQGDVTWDVTGRPLRQFGVLQDITELRQAEDELRSSEARFRTLVDHATDAFFLRDEHLNLLDVNRQACESLGYSREELIGTLPRDIDVGLDDAAIARLMDRVRAGETVTFESLHRRKDETTFPVEIRIRQIEQGERRFFIGLVRDISVRKRAERRQLAEHGVARILAEAATVEEAIPEILRIVCRCLDWDLGALWRIDKQAGVLRCARLWRKPSVEVPEFEAVTWQTTFQLGSGLPGSVWASHVPACVPDVVNDPTFLRAPIAAREGLHAAFAFPILLGSEVLGVIDFLSREVRQPDQDLLDMMAAIGSQIGQFLDRKRAEDALKLAQAELAHVTRVTTMGELTASIAHEVNQPIAAARNNAGAALRFLDRNPPELEEVREALLCAVSDVDRAGGIIDRIRDHVRKAAPRNEIVNINDAIEDVVALTKDEAAKNNVSIETRLATGLAPVLGDRVQLQQVVLNLILNAVEAMRSNDGEPGTVSISADTDPSGGVVVAVRDSGPGISPEDLDRIFESFYTTKSGGMGMGLSICRSIVEAHGGKLWVATNAPRGALFQFTIPTRKGNS